MRLLYAAAAQDTMEESSVDDVSDSKVCLADSCTRHLVYMGYEKQDIAFMQV